MKLDSYKCDGCGVMKGSTNHWFLMRTIGERLYVYEWTALVSRAGCQHLCGDSCVQKAVQAWLSSRG